MVFAARQQLIWSGNVPQARRFASLRDESLAGLPADLAGRPGLHEGNRPVLVVAEGLVQYLPEHDRGALLNRITEQFPHGEIIFDAYSRLLSPPPQAGLGRLVPDHARDGAAAPPLSDPGGVVPADGALELVSPIDAALPLRVLIAILLRPGQPDLAAETGLSLMLCLASGPAI